MGEGKYTYLSDVDVLIVTEVKPVKVYFELWKAGVKELFEIHVQPPWK